MKCVDGSCAVGLKVPPRCMAVSGEATRFLLMRILEHEAVSSRTAGRR